MKYSAVSSVGLVLAALLVAVSCAKKEADTATAGGTRPHGAADSEPKRRRVTELDARNAKAPPRFEVKAPQARRTS